MSQFVARPASTMDSMAALVRHGQRARQAQAHGTRVRVGLGAELQLAAAEHLGLERGELGVDLEADDGLPVLQHLFELPHVTHLPLRPAPGRPRRRPVAQTVLLARTAPAGLPARAELAWWTPPRACPIRCEAGQIDSRERRRPRPGCRRRASVGSTPSRKAGATGAGPYAVSSAAATRSMFSSLNCGETSCTPTGRPRVGAQARRQAHAAVARDVDGDGEHVGQVHVGRIAHLAEL